MPKFVIERQYLVPLYQHIAVEAETFEEACDMAMSDDISWDSLGDGLRQRKGDHPHRRQGDTRRLRGHPGTAGADRRRRPDQDQSRLFSLRE